MSASQTPNQDSSVQELVDPPDEVENNVANTALASNEIPLTKVLASTTLSRTAVAASEEPSIRPSELTLTRAATPDDVTNSPAVEEPVQFLHATISEEPDVTTSPALEEQGQPSYATTLSGTDAEAAGDTTATWDPAKDVIPGHNLTRRSSMRAMCSGTGEASQSSTRRFTLKRTRRLNLERVATPLPMPERKRERSPSVASSLRALLFGTWLNLLLVFVPIMFAFRFVRASANGEVFAFAFLALLPTAKIFGLAMEDAALRFNRNNAGGFIRVLAGNAIELISGIVALIQCQLEVLQASLVGSILINILLVLGAAIFFGGIKFSEQGFGASSSQMSIQLMTLATVATLLPTMFAASYGGSTTEDLEQIRISIVRISRAVSVALLICYILFVFFHFYSHATIYGDDSGDRIRSTKYIPREKKRRAETYNIEQYLSAEMESPVEEEEEEEENVPEITVSITIITVVLTGAMICVLSEYLVGSLQNITKSLAKQWVGLILIPLAGTFARHDLLEARKYGTKDKMTESFNLAIGSSINLSLCIQPILILVAWAMHKNLTLLYDPFETMAQFLCVLLVNFSIMDGKSSWLTGALLIILYTLIAISFWFYTGTHVFSNLILAC
ncbi:hypothetical protein DFH06DRAFT_322174 [Mycena polygramma]|nr:hypothetical protein DFH06DRAFT_322174 [Mycena polygramma]